MHAFRFLRRLTRDERGVSAVEFAIIGPVLIFGMLAMVDIGLALGERMDMDRSVRAGAQAAMSLNNLEEGIETIVLASAGSPEGLSVDVTTTCECVGVAVSCGLPCTSGDAPSVFIGISASKTQPALLLPDMALRANTRVQIR
jgi:Flp pilus assembly pilin Flp